MFAVDIDSTVALFMPSFLQIINRDYGTNFIPKDIHAYDLAEQIGIPGSCIAQAMWQMDLSMLEPVPYSQEGVTRLNLWDEVVFITSRSKATKEVTRRWIDKHFGPYKIFHTSRPKYLTTYGLNNCRVLIDDNPAEIKAFGEGVHNAVPILFDRPWNKDCYTTHIVYSWRGVINVLTDRGLIGYDDRLST